MKRLFGMAVSGSSSLVVGEEMCRFCFLTLRSIFLGQTEAWVCLFYLYFIIIYYYIELLYIIII